jgi:transcriptional antiterminator NusG
MRNYYILKVASGSEHQVVEYLKKLMSNSFLGKYIFNPVVPEVTSEKKIKGKKREFKSKLYPGYVFLEIDFSDEINEENYWKKITKEILSLSSVAGFLGVKRTDKPIPLTKSEVRSYLLNIGQIKENESEESNIIYEKGEEVTITGGGFKGFSGIIKEIDKDKSKVIVEVKIFDRPTPVELMTDQIEKR